MYRDCQPIPAVVSSAAIVSRPRQEFAIRGCRVTGVNLEITIFCLA
jgi:hypothetical protein